MDLIPLNLEAIFKKGNETITEKISDAVCNVEIYDVFLWWVLPFLILGLMLVIIRYKDFFIDRVLKIKSNKGYIKIILRRENKVLKEFLVKVDTYGNFTFGKRRYTIENLQDFIIGYDKHRFPVFFYDYQFILPLTLTKKTIDANLTKLLKPGLKDGEKLEDKISEFSMKINPSILDLVYSRKLMSDLYSISGSIEMKEKLIYIGLAVAGIIALYYTGLLAIIFGFFGIVI